VLGRIFGELSIGDIATNQHHFTVEVHLDKFAEFQTDVLAFYVVEAIGNRVLRVRSRQRFADRLGQHGGVAQL